MYDYLGAYYVIARAASPLFRVLNHPFIFSQIQLSVAGFLPLGRRHRRRRRRFFPSSSFSHTHIRTHPHTHTDGERVFRIAYYVQM